MGHRTVRGDGGGTELLHFKPLPQSHFSLNIALGSRFSREGMSQTEEHFAMVSRLRVKCPESTAYCTR